MEKKFEKQIKNLKDERKHQDHHCADLTRHMREYRDQYEKNLEELRNLKEEKNMIMLTHMDEIR